MGCTISVLDVAKLVPPVGILSCRVSLFFSFYFFIFTLLYIDMRFTILLVFVMNFNELQRLMLEDELLLIAEAEENGVAAALFKSETTAASMIGASGRRVDGPFAGCTS